MPQFFLIKMIWETNVRIYEVQEFFLAKHLHKKSGWGLGGKLPLEKNHSCERRTTKWLCADATLSSFIFSISAVVSDICCCCISHISCFAYSIY